MIKQNIEKESETIKRFQQELIQEKQQEDKQKIKNQKFFLESLESERQKNLLRNEIRESYLAEDKKVLNDAMRIQENLDKQKEDFKKHMAERLLKSTIMHENSDMNLMEKVRWEREESMLNTYLKKEEERYIIHYKSNL